MGKWNDKAEEAFLELNTALCQTPVLVAPNFSKEFIAQMDATSQSLGAVLSQKVTEGGTPLGLSQEEFDSCQEKTTPY